MAQLTSQVVVIGKLTRALKGNAVASTLLNQLMYWQGKHGEGFYVTSENLTEQVGISRKSQIKARKVLVELGLLTEERKGLPARLYFTVNVEAVAVLLEPLIGECSVDLRVVYGMVKKAPKTPSVPVVTTGSQQAITTELQPEDTTGSQPDATTGSQPVFISRVTTSKEEGIKEGTKEGSRGSAPPPVESSEARFARETRQRTNGTYISPYSLEANDHLAHLKEIIGSQNIRQEQVQDNYLRWYRDFGEEFVETAWQLSAKVALEKNKRQLWAFVDLFNEYPHYPKLANLVRQKHEAEQVPPAPRRNFEQGDRVTFKGKFYTVDETDGVGDFLELRDDGGTLLNAVPSKHVFPAEVAQ